MTLSKRGLDWLKKIERLSLLPYDDQTGKLTSVWVPGATIGYGHLIAKAEWDKYKAGITAEQADELKRADLRRFIAVVKETKASLLQHQFDALVILAYNIGVTAYLNSTVKRMLENPEFKSPRYNTLEAAWKAFNKSQGKFNKGVANRRAAEWDMYNQGVYRYW